MKRFLDQSAIDVYFEKCYAVGNTTRVFMIDKNIVSVVVSELLVPQLEAKDKGNDKPDADTIDEAEVIPPLRVMDVLEPPYELAENGSKSVSCYQVKLAKKSTSFDYVMSLLAAGLPSRQTSRVVRVNRDRLGCA